MGLDMYLHARQYVRQYSWNEKTGEYSTNEEFSKLIDSLDMTGETAEYGATRVDVPVGYWRKANAIHNWIVDNCGGGVDECQEIELEPSDVGELIDNCNQVLANPELAHELLPPRSGFFFGSTEVDEYYLEDLRHTVDILNKVVRLATEGKVHTLIYQASW